MNTPDFEKRIEWINERFPLDKIGKAYIRFHFIDCWTTHVEPLQAENVKLSQWKKEMLEVWGKVWDYMQNDKTVALGSSMSEETLRRLKAFNDLQSENQKLREALEPFQKIGIELLNTFQTDQTIYSFNGAEITREDYKKVVELLKLDKTNP